MAAALDNRMRVESLWGDTRKIRYYVSDQNKLHIKYPKPMIDKLLEIKEEFGDVVVQFEVDIIYKNIPGRTKYYLLRENTYMNVYESYKDIVDAEEELNERIEDYYEKTIQLIKIYEYIISIHKCDNPKMREKQVRRLQVKKNVDGHDLYIRYITEDRKELRAKFPEAIINKLKEIREKHGEVKVLFRVLLKYEDYYDGTILERIGTNYYILDSADNLEDPEDTINMQIEDIGKFNDLINIDEYIIVVDKK